MGKEINLYQVLRRPLVTEKGSLLQEKGKYAFEVSSKANKVQIKEAVEKAFKVKVTAVNVLTVAGKMHRFGKGQGMTSEWKKAIVTLKEGDTIQIFEGV